MVSVQFLNIRTSSTTHPESFLGFGSFPPGDQMVCVQGMQKKALEKTFGKVHALPKMHGISKPNRNIFELSVLLNYSLTRYSGSDRKLPGFLFSFFFSFHARCLASPASILFPAFHRLPRTLPLWNRKPCQLLGQQQSTAMSNRMER